MLGPSYEVTFDTLAHSHVLDKEHYIASVGDKNERVDMNVIYADQNIASVNHEKVEQISQ